MQPGYEVSRIADAFQSLSSILMPNTAGLIEADLAQAKKGNLVADTNRINVDAGRLAADRDRLKAETAMTDQERLAAANLAQILATGDLTDPAVRAAAAAATAMMENGLANGPAGLTGLSTYANPDFVPDNESFSRVILGTGVVDDFGKTPTGFYDSETNDLVANDADNRSLELRNDADNATTIKTTEMELAAPGGKDRNPVDVTPKGAQELADLLASNISAEFGVDVENIDPKLLRRLTAQVADGYQAKENAAAAIADVLSGLEMVDGQLRVKGEKGNEEQASGWGQGDWLNALLAGVMPSLAPTMLPSLGTSGAAATAQPSASAPAPSASASTPAPAPAGTPIIKRNPQTGQMVMLDPATNTWKPVGPVRSQ